MVLKDADVASAKLGSIEIVFRAPAPPEPLEPTTRIVEIHSPAQTGGVPTRNTGYSALFGSEKPPTFTPAKGE